MVDIAGNTSTNVTVTVGGGPTTNTVDSIGDHDWFRLNLTAGQTVTITLNGVTLSDPYLRIWQSDGTTLVKENDDYGSLNSQLSFVASYTGVYYIDVAAWADPQNPGASYPGVTGDYQLNVTAFQTPPVYTNDQIANQLTVGYWGDGSIHRFILDGTRTLTVNLTGLTSDGANLAREALQTWSQITGISFVETSSLSAKIMFTDDDPDGGAFTESTYNQNGDITSSHVNVDLSWLSDYGPNVGSYAYQAYLHEIGHALGLGHAGNYNTTADYPVDAIFANDAWNTSVMSYFSQTENTYFSSQGFTRANDVTPMVADILAIQQLYGLSTTIRSGNTTYGFNSNAGSPYNADLLSNVAFTIFDMGGIDTLDYSGYAFNQTINLNPETFSSIGGERGNVSIARGTIIENAIGGSFKDTIIGNSVANVLTGGGGVDTLTGGLGNDTFSDTRAGFNGDLISDFSLGDKVVFTDATLGSFTFSLTGTTLTYSGGSMTLQAPIAGTLVASAVLGGGVQLTITPSYDVFNDFNGDHRSDLLLRHGSGTLTNWLGNPNGSFADNWGNLQSPLPTGWQVASVGDFNGDGRDDMLLRYTNGTMTDWLGNPNGSFTDNWGNFQLNLSTDWQVEGVGDFNGDGRDDMLLRHNSGTMTTWVGSPNGSLADNWGNYNVPLPNSWQVMGIGDFNGDGKDDILLRHDSGTLTDWLGNSTGGFTDNWSNFQLPLSNDWKVVGVGDFNGDGRDDLLLRYTNGTLTDWLGTANGGLSDNWGNFQVNLSNNWQIESVGDFNGDGRDDIALRDTSGTVTDWLGAANGGFVDNFGVYWRALPSSWEIQTHDYLV